MAETVTIDELRTVATAAGIDHLGVAAAAAFVETTRDPRSETR